MGLADNTARRAGAAPAPNRRTTARPMPVLAPSNVRAANDFLASVEKARNLTEGPLASVLSAIPGPVGQAHYLATTVPRTMMAIKDVATKKADVGDYLTLSEQILPPIGAGALKAAGATAGGLKALPKVAAMTRRSKTPAPSQLTPEATRIQQAVDGGGRAGGNYGPGTYFSNRAAQKTRWNEWGDNIQRLALSPGGYLQIMRSKGFKPTSEISGNIYSEGLDSPVIKDLVDQGYIGITEGRRPGSIANDVTTLFDPTTLKGARLKDIGVRDSYNVWQSQNPIRGLENEARNALVAYLSRTPRAQIKQNPNNWNVAGNLELLQNTGKRVNRDVQKALQQFLNKDKKAASMMVEPEA